VLASLESGLFTKEEIHALTGQDALGWDEFVLRQWESIFLGYRSNAGIRAVGRRWSDLIQAGLGCSQEVADLLVKAEFLDRVDRDLEGARSQTELVARMTDVLIDLASALSDLPQIPPDRLAALVEQHTLLVDALVGSASAD
jgi:hypothetical protein